ncbi:MAG: 50S ribosomal protein L27 [Elusimicrobia bacterium]|nr:50S ribosomal protein L27 [Elusimicrobiota bacterium]
MASVKSQGSTSNGRDSPGQRLGVKVFGGEKIHAGSVIVRQRGSPIAPGHNTLKGKDDTIFAQISGIVKFEWMRGTPGRRGVGRRCVSVYPVPTNA